MRRFLTSILIAVGSIILLWHPAAAQHIGSSAPMKLGIPAYFYPAICAGCCLDCWEQMVVDAPTMGIAILNPFNGPGSQFDQNYDDVATDLTGQGIQVIGYIHTDSDPVADVRRPLAALYAEIDTYYARYPIDGIFLDEAYVIENQCAVIQDFYIPLRHYIKSKDANAVVVLNAGEIMPECFMQAADILLNAEKTAADYPNWQPQGWEWKYPPSRFWHLIHTTPVGEWDEMLDLASQRGSGYVYVTDDGADGNPWDSLPLNSFWADQVNWLKDYSANFIGNGAFTTSIGGWSSFYAIEVAWNSGRAFITPLARPDESPGGVFFQSTHVVVNVGVQLEALIELRNASGTRKRATILLHDADFSDLQVCTFWIPADNVSYRYRIETFAGEAWQNATLSIYPSGTLGGGLFIDQVVLRTQPTLNELQTRCHDPNAP
ncbi:MAG: spherulation-specific family 4 protein [Chloroflexota bacterium]|nr:spherulation-specific family 4 protein [Chloroflexota bacterium]